MEVYADAALEFLHHVAVNDLPELLSLSANALRNAPFKSSVKSWLYTTTIDDVLALAPFLGFAAVLGSMVMAIAQSRAAASTPDAKEAYWLTRIVLLRGMGIIYFAAFLTYVQVRTVRIYAQYS